MYHDIYELSFLGKIIFILKTVLLVFLGVLLTAFLMKYGYRFYLFENEKLSDSYYVHYKSRYSYLEETTDEVMYLGDILDLKNLPEDINYSYFREDGEIKVQFLLSGTDDISIEYCLDEKNNILSKESKFLSEEAFHESVQKSIKADILCCILIIIVVVFCFAYGLYCIINFIIYLFK